jgi:hypothetical protein
MGLKIQDRPFMLPPDVLFFRGKLREFFMRLTLTVAIAALSLSIQPSFAQKPAASPDHRAAAEQRRAERLKQNECAIKAKAAKVLPSDRAAFVSNCAETK